MQPFIGSVQFECSHATGHDPRRAAGDGCARLHKRPRRPRQRLRRSSAARARGGHSLPVVRQGGRAEVAAFLREHQPDWLFAVGLSQLIPQELRDIARIDAIGFHPTPLPEGRGRAPVAWTILLQRPAAASLFILTGEAMPATSSSRGRSKYAPTTTPPT